MRVQMTVTVDKPLEKVFAYLSDFTTTNEWDPGTVKTVLASGDGGFGTEYLNTSTFNGRQTQLTYTVIDLVPNERFGLRGENKSLIAHDTMTFREIGNRTEVTYTADFTFKGITRLAAPFLKPAFDRLRVEAETGMTSALSRL